MDNRDKLPFSETEIKAVLGSEEGKKLMALLNRDGGAILRQAAASIQSGDQKGAAELLSPLMQSPEAAELVKKINDRKMQNG